MKETRCDVNSLKGKDGKTVEQSLQQVPEVYEKVVWGVYGLLAIILLLSVGVVFLSLHWRAGLKKISIMFIIIGSISILLNILAGLGLGKAEELVKEPLQTSGLRVGEILAGDLRTWWMVYGITLLVVGIGTLITLRLTRKKLEDELHKEVVNDPVKESTPAPEQATTSSSAKPKPRPQKKLVQ